MDTQMDESGLLDDELIMEERNAMKINQEKAYRNMLAQVVGIILGSPEFQRR